MEIKLNQKGYEHLRTILDDLNEAIKFQDFYCWLGTLCEFANFRNGVEWAYKNFVKKDE